MSVGDKPVMLLLQEGGLITPLHEEEPELVKLQVAGTQSHLCWTNQTVIALSFLSELG